MAGRLLETARRARATRMLALTLVVASLSLALPQLASAAGNVPSFAPDDSGPWMEPLRKLVGWLLAIGLVSSGAMAVMGLLRWGASRRAGAFASATDGIGEFLVSLVVFVALLSFNSLLGAAAVLRF